MLLNDIGKSPDATFRKINQHLESNYGFRISEDVSDKDLVMIMEQIEGEITELKIKGNDAKESPEISKRLLVLEGIRNLREFAIVQLQSPKLNSVLSNLTDFVVDTFEISGMQQTDFDAAIARAMDEYRSSRYRFPDDFIEQRVRQDAMNRIQAANNIPTSEPAMSFPMMEDDLDVEENDEASIGEIEEGAFDNEGKRSGGLGGHAAQMPDTRAARHAMNVLNNPELYLEPENNDQVAMIRDKNGRMVPDPFAAQAAARRKGIVMKENLVKNLRRLLETEVSQAEVMMAAKGFAQELQEMIEKIGRLQNEDLPPVTDQMRETYGTESSSAFQTQIAGALQSVMDSLYAAKSQVDNAVSNMAATGQVDAAVDMDKEMGMGDEMGGMGDEMGMDADLDNIAADDDSLGVDDEMGDDFGAADGEEPLGRAMKEAALQRKVMEMKRLVEKARKLKESKARK